MAGMKIVVVNTDEAGNIDVDDLKQRAEEHRAESGRSDGHVPVHARRL